MILGLSCQVHANLNQAWRLHFEQVEVGGSSNSLRPGLHVVGTATFSGSSDYRKLLIYLRTRYLAPLC